MSTRKDEEMNRLEIRLEALELAVQPLVDALELLAATVYTGMHPPFHVRIAREALDNYRKAMVEK